MQRLLARVWGWGALTWVGLAWLAGPLPGFGTRGVTGQPTGELWWWHVAAGGLALLAVVEAAGASDLAARVDRAARRMWRPGRRWRTVVVMGWLVLAVLAAARIAEGSASLGEVVTFLAAAAIVGLAPVRTVGGAAVPRLAVGALALGAAGVVTFLLAVPDALDDPAAFYTIKEQVRAPVAAHNVLAGFLLAGAPAVALASVRRPRRWWPVVVVLGLALGATLSRGAVVAGVVAVAVARYGLRDRAVAARVGVVVVLGGVGIAVALSALGAATPDPDGPPSTVARAELWQAAADVTVERPLTGVGPDGFLAETQQRGLAAPHEHAHDLPLHAAATLGLPGLFATGAVWGGIAAGAVGQLDRDRRALVLAALVGLGALALVDEIALRPATEGLLALLAVTVAAPRDPGFLRPSAGG